MINIDAVSETSGKSGLWKFLTRRIICLALEDYNLISNEPIKEELINNDTSCGECYIQTQKIIHCTYIGKRNSARL